MLERPGIDLTWQRKWKTRCRNGAEWISINGASSISALEYYANKGEPAPNPYYSPGMIVYPDPQPEIWEDTFITRPLQTYGQMRLLEFEMRAVNEKKWDSDLAQRAFSSFFTGQMAETSAGCKHMLRRAGQRPLLDMGGVHFSAFGILIGNHEQAFRLAQLYVKSHHRQWLWLAEKYYPISNFIVRVIADYLDQPALHLEGGALKEPVHNRLFEVWRKDDLDGLAEACLAACDVHTHQCKINKAHQFYDFSGMNWLRTPIGVMLVFKLRQMLGLANPVLDHPLMNTPLGVLPEEVPFKPDDLIARVRQRMELDGYDENRIFSDFCKI